MGETPSQGPDWIELLAKAAGAVGLNQVRVRWKLMAWRDSLKASGNRKREAVDHIRYQHKVCSRCGSVQDRSNQTCLNCGATLTPRFWQMLGRLGVHAPMFGSVTSLLTALILVTYLRQMASQGWAGLFGMNIDVLMSMGAHWPPAVAQGQWWRLATAIFLHIGVLHLAFNLMALQQIGPVIEETFGSGRMLFFFMTTGILASVGSEIAGLSGVSAGASGALMGLVGLAAGWGQRDGTSAGRQTRDLMVKWGIYTVMYGIFLHADNGAHISGFISGFLMGLVAKPQWDWRDPKHSPLTRILTGVGIVLLLLTAYFLFFPKPFEIAP